MVSSRDIYRDRWVVAVREDVVTSPSGEGEFSRIVIEHPGAALVLAVDENERVCCVRQYRHVVGESLVQLPAGVCDVPGEDPLETAKRELREEAELEASIWTHLTSVYATPGVSQEMHHLYLAQGLTVAPRGDFALEHEEAELEVFWVAFDDLLAAVLAGEVKDAPLAIGVLSYAHLRAAR